MNEHPQHRRRGTLKNGSPSGDFLAAPRCGVPSGCRSFWAAGSTRPRHNYDAFDVALNGCA